MQHGTGSAMAFSVQTLSTIILLLAFVGVITCAYGYAQSQWKKTWGALLQEKEDSAKLQKANIELELFTRTVSHDLKEPLRTVTTYLKVLEREHHSSLSAEAKKAIQTVVSANRRLVLLVDSLLSLARSSDQPLKLFPVDLNQLFDEVVASLQSSVSEKQAIVTHDLLPMVFGDRLQLSQLLQNLLSNALKYSQQGTIPHIHFSSARNQSQDWVVSVRDNGVGIAGKNVDRIFQPFQRLRDVSSSAVQGNGIGLAVCKKIVEAHCGKIWVASKRGIGSVFFFSIPTPPANNLAFLHNSSQSFKERTVHSNVGS